MASINADILRQHFGFNDPNVINNILNNPGEVSRYEREYEGILHPSAPQPSSVSSIDLEAKQKQESDAFMAALNQKVAGQESITDAASRIGEGLNLPTLQNSAQSLTDTLKQASESFRDITPGQQTLSKQTGMSTNLLNARIASEQQKQQPVVETASRAAQTALSAQQSAEAQLGTQLGYLVAEQEKELRPYYEAELPLLQQRLAQEQTNYTNDKRNELDLLIQQMNNNTALTIAELDRAQELAMAETTYEQSLEKIKLSTDEAIREATALRELKGSSGGSVDDGW